MFGRGVIITAIMLYLAVALGCLVGPSPSAIGQRTDEDAAAPFTPSARLDDLPYRGVAIQIQRVDWIDEYKHCIDKAAEDGADTVLLVVSARMENGSSSLIYLDMRQTPTPQQLGDLIDHAKSKHLRAILMPIVLLDVPRGDEWRGALKPESWTEWWSSYRAMMAHYAWVAQEHHVDVLVVGSELVTTENNLPEWTRTISEIRKTYKGKLTYSANWDHYTSVPFWNQLDLIGMNSYYTLGDDRHVSVSEIERRWRDIQKDLLSFQKKQGKPILFLEVGWCSLANAATEPWDYTQESVPIDLDLQKRLYEGFFQSWYGNPALGGFMIWEWTPWGGGPKNRGYTPEGKPAEKVLREWLAKPRWKVR